MNVGKTGPSRQYWIYAFVNPPILCYLIKLVSTSFIHYAVNETRNKKKNFHILYINLIVFQI